MGNTRPFTPREEKIFRTVAKPLAMLNTWVFRITGGKLGGRFPSGAPVLLLTTIGKKSGQKRTSPLLYLEENGAYFIVASMGGMSKHPLWYANLLANPDVEVEIGTRKQAMKARVLAEDEKAAVWPKLVAMYPDYADYQKRTDRRIPVIKLSPT